MIIAGTVRVRVTGMATARVHVLVGTVTAQAHARVGMVTARAHVPVGMAIIVHVPAIGMAIVATTITVMVTVATMTAGGIHWQLLALVQSLVARLRTSQHHSRYIVTAITMFSGAIIAISPTVLRTIHSSLITVHVGSAIRLTDDSNLNFENDSRLARAAVFIGSISSKVHSGFLRGIIRPDKYPRYFQ